MTKDASSDRPEPERSFPATRANADGRSNHTGDARKQDVKMDTDQGTLLVLCTMPNVLESRYLLQCLFII